MSVPTVLDTLKIKTEKLNVKYLGIFIATSVAVIA